MLTGLGRLEVESIREQEKSERKEVLRKEETKERAEAIYS